MANGIDISELADAIDQTLTIYHANVLERIDKAGEDAMKELVKRTKATAPVGKRQRGFKRSISSKVLERGPRGSKRVWFVKSPDHRLTHLLVHGHATKNGGRTSADPFLQNAVDTVLPEYEAAVEEAIRNA